MLFAVFMSAEKVIFFDSFSKSIVIRFSVCDAVRKNMVIIP